MWTRLKNYCHRSVIVIAFSISQRSSWYCYILSACSRFGFPTRNGCAIFEMKIQSAITGALAVPSSEIPLRRNENRKNIVSMAILIALLILLQRKMLCNVCAYWKRFTHGTLVPWLSSTRFFVIFFFVFSSFYVILILLFFRFHHFMYILPFATTTFGVRSHFSVKWHPKMKFRLRYPTPACLSTNSVLIIQNLYQ